MLNWVAAAFSLVILVFYCITLILLFASKSRIEGKLRKVIAFFITGIFTLAATRVLNLLSISDIFSIPYLHEFLVFAFSVFTLIAVIEFHKTVKTACSPNYSKKAKRKK